MTDTVKEEINFNSTSVGAVILLSVFVGVICASITGLFISDYIYVLLGVFIIWPLLASLMLFGMYAEYKEQEDAKAADAIANPIPAWKQLLNELGKSDIFVVYNGIECDVSNDECLGFSIVDNGRRNSIEDVTRKFVMRNKATGWFYILDIENDLSFDWGAVGLTYKENIYVPSTCTAMHDNVGSFDIDLWREVSPKIPTEDFNTLK